MKDLFDLDGKVIVVTGATGVLGAVQPTTCKKMELRWYTWVEIMKKWMLHWLRPKQYPMNAWA